MFEDIKINTLPFSKYSAWQFKYKGEDYGCEYETKNTIIVVEGMLKTMKILVNRDKRRGTKCLTTTRQ
jgi:hypothetical protein